MSDGWTQKSDFTRRSDIVFQNKINARSNIIQYKVDKYTRGSGRFVGHENVQRLSGMSCRQINKRKGNFVVCNIVIIPISKVQLRLDQKLMKLYILANFPQAFYCGRTVFGELYYDKI